MYQQDVWMPTLARAVRVEWPTVGARSQDLRVLTSTIGGPSHMSPASEDGLMLLGFLVGSAAALPFFLLAQAGPTVLVGAAGPVADRERAGNAHRWS